jgi:hypothetical protein
MTALAVGQEFDGYLIKGELGRGGMGVVYLAEQLRLGRDVALKAIAAELSTDAGYKARFQREARLAASLDHPNIVPVFEAGEAEGLLYLAMRYVDGTDLAALLAREGRLETHLAATIVRQVAAALDAAHQKGVIHRDVKPANVLVANGRDGDPHVYLTDFGIAKDSAANTGLTHTGEWVGTLDYVAPEQFEKGRVDARADIYSLGCVLFQMLSGGVPYEGTAMQKMWSHANETPPSLADTDADVARAFDPVNARAMAKRPEDRFPSAGDLGRAGVAAASGARVTVAERSVATGAAATGVSDSVAPTRHIVEQSATEPLRLASEAQRPDDATARLAQPRRRLRGLGVAAAVLALVTAGVAGGMALSNSDDGGSERTAAAEPADRATTSDELAAPRETEPKAPKRKPKPAARTPEPAAEPAPTPAPRPNPVRYTGYSPAGGGFWTEIPSGGGWSAPVETEETRGRLYRTTVRGSDGLLLIIDHTPLEPAAFGAGYHSRRELPHPWFGSMTEYLFTGGSIPECQTTTCVDYIVNSAGSGPGFGVLAGGTTDTALARSIARHVAKKLVVEDA